MGMHLLKDKLKSIESHPEWSKACPKGTAKNTMKRRVLKRA
jgi:hypothetical protein